MLKSMLPYYLKNIINDSVIINNIIYSIKVKDTWYERELQRYNIRIDSTPNKLVPHYKNNIRHRFSFLFNWTEEMSITYNNKTYSISRGTEWFIHTNINGILKTNMSEEDVTKSEFIFTTTEQIKKETKTTPVNENIQHRPKVTRKSNPLGREKREPKPKPKQPQQPQQQEQPKTPIVNNNGNDSNTIKRGKINIDLTF